MDEPTAESVHGMARRLDKAFAEGPEVAKAVLEEIAARHGRDTAVAALEEWQRRNDAARFEATEAIANLKKSERQCTEMTRLLRACPKGTKLDAAARIMAARGDKFARGLVAHFDSRKYRLELALANAAVELHPGWRGSPDGSFTKLNPSAPEQLELTEWLYKTHPARARAIEQTVAE